VEVVEVELPKVRPPKASSRPPKAEDCPLAAACILPKDA
jgi:hypothetical protein